MIPSLKIIIHCCRVVTVPSPQSLPYVIFFWARRSCCAGFGGPLLRAGCRGGPASGARVRLHQLEFRVSEPWNLSGLQYYHDDNARTVATPSDSHGDSEALKVTGSTVPARCHHHQAEVISGRARRWGRFRTAAPAHGRAAESGPSSQTAA